MRANSQSDDETIEQQAADWLVRRETGLSAAEAEQLARWRAADPRHAAALRRLEATQGLLSRLPESPAAAAMLAEVDELYRARERGRVTPFAGWWKAAAGAAAAVAIGAGLWLGVSRVNNSEANRVYVTAAAEHRAVALPDGSTMVLNSASEVAVAFAAAERRVQLRRGETHFHVAQDAARPFFVAAGPVTVRAVGTAFKVRRETQAVEVRVTEGRVQVSHAETQKSGGAAAPLYLVAGEGALWEDGGRATMLAANSGAARAVAGPGAAGSPRLSFNNTPLAEVVEQFNRYNRVQMEIADPALARLPVGGNFAANNAESFIRLLAAGGEVRLVRVAEDRVLLASPK